MKYEISDADNVTFIKNYWEIGNTPYIREFEHEGAPEELIEALKLEGLLDKQTEYCADEPDDGGFYINVKVNDFPVLWIQEEEEEEEEEEEAEVQQ